MHLSHTWAELVTRPRPFLATHAGASCKHDAAKPPDSACDDCGCVLLLGDGGEGDAQQKPTSPPGPCG